MLAAAVCSNTPGAGNTISCTQSSGSTGVTINAVNQSISTTAGSSAGYAVYGAVTGTRVSTCTVFGHIGNQSSTAALTVDATGASTTNTISISAGNAYAVLAINDGRGTTGVTLSNADVFASGDVRDDVHAWAPNNAAGAVTVSATNGTISTTCELGFGFSALIAGTRVGFVTPPISGSTAAVNVDAIGVTVTTTGLEAHGLSAVSGGTGLADIDLTTGATVTVTGDEAWGGIPRARGRFRSI